MIFDDITAEQLSLVTDEIIHLSQSDTVFCLYGDLGAGKTTLVKNICEKLNVEGNISSPTYPIINEYNYSSGKIYHIDLYRIKSIDEALNIGLEDYLYSGSLCFIEWPDNFESMLPPGHIKIFIRKLDEQTRQLEILRSKE